MEHLQETTSISSYRVLRRGQNQSGKFSEVVIYLLSLLTILILTPRPRLMESPLTGSYQTLWQGEKYILEGLERAIKCSNLIASVIFAHKLLTKTNYRTPCSLEKVSKCNPTMDPQGQGAVCSMGEKEVAPHSTILAWKIPWTEEPGRLQSMGSRRVHTTE